MKLRELVTVLSYEIDETQLRAAEKSFDGLKKKANEVASVTGKLGQQLTTWVTLPILAFAGLAARAADQTQDANERLANTFFEVGEEATAASKRIQEGYGLSQRSAGMMLSTTADILLNFGLTQKQVLGLSDSVVKMGADLAAFRKFEGGTAGAVDILTNALAGQTKGLKALGIVLDQDEIKNRIANMQAAGRVFTTERQAQVLATLSLIQDRAARSVGAYEQNEKGLGETWDRNLEHLQEIGASFGKFLIPILEKANLALERLLKWVNGLSDRFKMFILVTAGLVAVLGPLLLAIAGVASAIGFMASGIALALPVIAGLNIALLPLLLKAALIAAAIAAVVLILEDFYTYLQGGPSYIGDFIAKLTEWGKAFTDWASAIGKAVGDWLKPLSAFLDTYAAVVRAGARGFQSTIRNVTDTLKPSAPSIAAAGAGSTSMSQANSIRLNVDARGSNPKETTEAVRSGLETSLTNTLTGAAEQLKPQRVN